MNPRSPLSGPDSPDAPPATEPARPVQVGVPAIPLCDRVPVLSVLELASRDARRRPLCLADTAPGESPELVAHLEEVRRHVHEERCSVCRRWYRNALQAYRIRAGQ